MTHTWKIAALAATVAAAGWIAGAAQAQQGYSSGGTESCQSCVSQVCLPQPGQWCCPKPFCHIQEGHPRIHYKCGCPRPICNPCDLPHYGYFQPCWKPYPFPPDWSHCSELPPAALIVPGPSPSGMNYPSDPDTTPLPPPTKKTPETLPPPIPGKLSLDPPMKY